MKKQMNKIKLKAKVTFEWEYEVKPEHYVGIVNDKGEIIENVTMKNIIKEDIKAANEDIYLFCDMCDKNPKVEIKEIKE